MAERIQKKGLGNIGREDRVLLPGWVSLDELVGIYNLAEAYVFPSLYEGFGISLLEAMACGCPVITSSRGAIPEIAGNQAIFVDALNTEEI